MSAAEDDDIVNLAPKRGINLLNEQRDITPFELIKNWSGKKPVSKKKEDTNPQSNSGKRGLSFFKQQKD